MEIGRASLIVFSMATIFSIGLTSIPVYAQFTDFSQCFVHVEWEDPINLPVNSAPTKLIDFDANCGFPLSLVEPILNCGTPDPTIGAQCTVVIPNFEDDLDRKIIFIDISYDPLELFQFILPTSTTCFEGGIPFPGVQTDQGIDGPGLFIYDIECIPNPDWEQIDIFLPPSTSLVEIWTESFNDLPDTMPVGGSLIPVDTTALLLAGVQSISMWMIPVVIAGVGIGVFLIKRRN